MFTRMVEIRSKPGKARDVASALSDKVLPLLQRQEGFIDEVVLVSTTESDRVVGLSFWKTEADAEHYNRNQFRNISEILSPFIETAPKVQTFNVETALTHRIAKGKAA